ncbi:hypothetical protein LguiA_031551 [Lonicera macranthoides]
MGLTGKLVGQKEIKSSGDLFHELFRHKPHHLSNITPTKVQGCDLHEGEWVTVGSIIFWNYVHEGKEQVAKEIIKAIDEEKKLVRFKVIEGDLLDSYKAMAITVHVETKGENHLPLLKCPLSFHTRLCHETTSLSAKIVTAEATFGRRKHNTVFLSSGAAREKHRVVFQPSGSGRGGDNFSWRIS